MNRALILVINQLSTDESVLQLFGKLRTIFDIANNNTTTDEQLLALVRCVLAEDWSICVKDFATCDKAMMSCS